MWENDSAIEAAMELEAHSKAFIETILHKVRAQRHIVARYLAGELQPDEAVQSSQDSADALVCKDGHVEKKSLTPSQKRLKKAISQQMEIGMAACRAETDADLEVCVEQASQHNPLRIWATRHWQDAHLARTSSPLETRRGQGSLCIAHGTAFIRTSGSAPRCGYGHLPWGLLVASPLARGDGHPDPI